MRKMKALMIIGGLCLVIGCTNSGTAPTRTHEVPQNVLPSNLQAENATTKTGGHAISRSNAEGQAVWHLENGDEISYSFIDLSPKTYTVVTKYSNDDTGGGDRLSILVNGVESGFFRTADTGDDGAGWNVFISSSPIPLGRLEGAGTISFHLTASDGYGVDLDAFTFTAIE